MKTVYHANSSFDAKLIVDQLSFADIEGHIMGDLLQGGVGELQPQGLVKVMVDESNFEKANEIVESWLAKSVDSKDADKIEPRLETLTIPKPEKQRNIGMKLLIVGIIVSLLGKYL